MTLRFENYTWNNGTEVVPYLMNVSLIEAFTIVPDGSGGFNTVALNPQGEIVIANYAELADAETAISAILADVNAVTLSYMQHTFNDGTENVSILVNLDQVESYSITEDGTYFYVTVYLNGNALNIGTYSTLGDAETALSSILSAVNA